MSSSTGSRLQSWVVGGGALGLTVAGVLLYAALRIPTSIFYGRLDATPESVGLGYGDLLAGSTLGVMLIFALLAMAVYTLAFAVGYISLMSRVAKVIRAPERREFLASMRRTPLEDYTDAELERAIEYDLMVLEAVPELAAQFTPEDVRSFYLRRRDALRRQSAQPDDESSPMSSEDPVHWDLRRLSFDAQATAMRRHRVVLVVASMVLAFLFGLPLLALAQAGQVRHGSAFDGSDLGLFAYNARPVTVQISGDAESAPGPEVADGDYFLLGQTAQFVTLYDAAADRSIQLPVARVVLMSRD